MKSAPNLLLLCPDEMKASALGCLGQTQPVSPFIDRLAVEGALFEQCHTVHPKCVPSRAALLTGQYAHVGGHRTLDLPVRAHQLNLIRHLRENGYQTALFGKNHVVDAATLPKTFDHYQREPGRATLEQVPGQELMPAGSYWVGRDPVPLEEWRDYTNTNNALEWLKVGRRRDQPFFAWINWDSPHPPYKVPAPFYGILDRATIQLPPQDAQGGQPGYVRRLFDTYGLRGMEPHHWRELIATYLEMVRFVDAEVERVFVGLQAAGLLENTIVALWSDHGDFAGEHQLVEKWDTSFYDCITRVPLVLWGPGYVQPRRTAALVESIDLLPTLIELAGLSVPRGVQGRSLGPVLRGEQAHHRDVVFCEGGQEQEMFDRVVAPNAKARPCHAYQLKQQAFYDEPMINVRAKMVRDAKFKYTWRVGGHEELYDLVKDPSEIINVASDPAYTARLQEWRLKLIHKLVEAETVEPYQGYVES